MRTRLIPFASYIGLAVGIAGGVGCSNLDLGNVPDPIGPPRIEHVVFLEQTRGLYSDLLNNAPSRACSDTDPCVPPIGICGQLYFAPVAGGPFDLGDTVCHDPENINEVKPGLDTQIRVVFNKILLDDAIGTDVDGEFEVVAGAMEVRDNAGNPISGSVSYDRTGSPRYTSDPFGLPYGPALVFTPESPLVPSENYTVVLNPSAIKARNGSQEPLMPADATQSFSTESMVQLAPINCPSGGCCPLPRLTESEACLTPEIVANRIQCRTDPTNPLPCPTGMICDRLSASVGEVCRTPIRSTSRPEDGETIATTDELYYPYVADVDTTALGGVTVQNSAGATVATMVDVTDTDVGFPRTVRIRPMAGTWAPGTNYRVTLSGIRAVDGGTMAPSVTRTFNVQ